MTEKQIEMLGKAKLEWLDQALQEHDVEPWVMDALRHSEVFSEEVFRAIFWLEVNGYTLHEKDNRAMLIKDGKVVSRFIWDVK